jgi:hypothetical protein
MSRNIKGCGMKFKQLILTLFLVFALSGSYAQDNSNTDPAQSDGFKYVAMAQQFAVWGYKDNKPLFLITAARTLIDYPVQGTFSPDSTEMINAGISPSKAGEKVIVLDPVVLLNDAETMAHGDTTVKLMIERTREKMKEGLVKPRGRKFSPLVQEYLLNAEGCIKLWATFNGNEIAEIFVAGNANSQLDLYLYDKNNRLVDSDMKKIGNCYVSFMPPVTTQFRIELRNTGKSSNQCLLMTN